jgi:hypothetical protein
MALPPTPAARRRWAPSTHGGHAMEAIVVYESVWGNTAAIARAIAEGMGDGTQAYATDAVPAERLASADLIVAGSPVFAFSLPSEGTRQRLLQSETDGPTPDLSHPSLRSWLDGLPVGKGFAAAFETRIWWSPRGATGTIEKKLAKVGYQRLASAEKFVVQDKYGPLREGELERARGWGASLRRSMLATARAA